MSRNDKIEDFATYHDLHGGSCYLSITAQSWRGLLITKHYNKKTFQEYLFVMWRHLRF